MIKTLPKPATTVQRFKVCLGTHADVMCSCAGGYGLWIAAVTPDLRSWHTVRGQRMQNLWGVVTLAILWPFGIQNEGKKCRGQIWNVAPFDSAYEYCIATRGIRVVREELIINLPSSLQQSTVPQTMHWLITLIQ